MYINKSTRFKAAELNLIRKVQANRHAVPNMKKKPEKSFKHKIFLGI